MILTADAEIVRQNRRQTPNGWNTAFIGANRYTLKSGEAPPAEGALNPVAFLVEKGPGGVTRPHFHRADQYQVVVGGYGKLGLHDTGGASRCIIPTRSRPMARSSRRARRIAWFTLRNGWDPGAKYMESLDSRAELRASRRQHTHWEATTEPLPAAGEAELKAATGTTTAQILEGDHGLASWRYRLPPGASLTGPEPSAGGGQYWVVLAGTLSTVGSGFLGVNSTIFVGPADGPLAVAAGPGGAEALCLQFSLVPFSARRR